MDETAFEHKIGLPASRAGIHSRVLGVRPQACDVRKNARLRIIRRHADDAPYLGRSQLPQIRFGARLDSLRDEKPLAPAL